MRWSQLKGSCRGGASLPASVHVIAATNKPAALQGKRLGLRLEMTSALQLCSSLLFGVCPTLQGKRLGLRLVLNHVLWGVGIGIILSLSKIGPKWLDPGGWMGQLYRAEMPAGMCGVSLGRSHQPALGRPHQSAAACMAAPARNGPSLPAYQRWPERLPMPPQTKPAPAPRRAVQARRRPARSTAAMRWELVSSTFSASTLRAAPSQWPSLQQVRVVVGSCRACAGQWFVVGLIIVAGMQCSAAACHPAGICIGCAPSPSPARSLPPHPAHVRMHSPWHPPFAPPLPQAGCGWLLPKPISAQLRLLPTNHAHIRSVLLIGRHVDGAPQAHRLRLHQGRPVHAGQARAGPLIDRLYSNVLLTCTAATLAATPDL